MSTFPVATIMGRFGTDVDYVANAETERITIKGILERGGEIANVGSARVGSEGLLLKCATEDVAGLTRSATFFIQDVEYKVTEYVIDHAGTALVYLALAQS